MSITLNSEFGILKTVIMHRPGKEIDRLTPGNKRDFLFEDVPYLEEMQREHDEFSGILKHEGVNVLRLNDLMMDILRNETIALDLFKHALKETNLEKYAEEFMEKLSTAEKAKALVAGVKSFEIRGKFKNGFLKAFEDHEFIIIPCPNMYFMRDPAAVVQAGIISCQMKYKGRHRESTLLKKVFENHPDLKSKSKIIYPSQNDGKTYPCIEGGDVMVLSKKTLLVGCSERTDADAIELVAKQVMKHSEVEKVYEVYLPQQRNFMHLDTVFTIIDENLVVMYSEAFTAMHKTGIYFNDGIDSEGNAKLRKEYHDLSILEILQQEIPYLERIETGDGNPHHAAREQWYDGANLFAIGPRRVISYNRNKFTNLALKAAGVEVIEIRSSELSRGLGGPRCMTMPLRREEC